MAKDWTVGSYEIDVIADEYFVYRFVPDLEFDIVEACDGDVRVRSPFIGHFSCESDGFLYELYQRLQIIWETVNSGEVFEEGHPFEGLSATRTLKSFKQTGALA